MKRSAPPILSGLLVVLICVPPSLGATPNPHVSSSIAVPQHYSGFTEPVKKIKISAAESGPVARICIKRGRQVRRGELLLELDTTVLDANRKVALAKSETMSRIDALKIESQVRKQRYEKLHKLQEDGAGSLEEVRRAKADASVAALEVDAALEEMQLRKLELQEIEARIEQRQVHSPIAGVITEVKKEAGEYVSMQDPHVATVVQLDQLRVTFYVPTRVAVSINAGAEVDLMLTETNQKCVGAVEYVGVVTEADSGTVRLDVLIDNPNRTFRSGVRCEMQSPVSSIRESTFTSQPGR